MLRSVGLLVWLALGLGVVAVAQPGLGGVYVSAADWATWANILTGPRGEVRRIELHSTEGNILVYDSLRYVDSDTMLLTDSKIHITQRYRNDINYYLTFSQVFSSTDGDMPHNQLYLGSNMCFGDGILIRFSTTPATQPRNPAAAFHSLVVGTYQLRGRAQSDFWLICRDSTGLRAYYASAGGSYLPIRIKKVDAQHGAIWVKPSGQKAYALYLVPAGLGRVCLSNQGSTHYTGWYYEQIAPGCAPETPTLPPRAPFDPLAPENFDRRTLIFD